MHLVTYDRGQGPRAGILDNDSIVDIGTLLPGWPTCSASSPRASARRRN